MIGAGRRQAAFRPARSLRLRIEVWTVSVFVAMTVAMTVFGIGHLGRPSLPGIIVHGAQGVVALGVVIAGAEWILRKRLLEPIEAISRQVRHMKRGGGWMAQLPEVDAELTPLQLELADLGPVLARQLETSLGAERRAAAAMALVHAGARARGPLVRARAIVSDLQARGVPDDRKAKRKLRALGRDLDAIAMILSPADEAWIASTAITEPDGASGIDEPVARANTGDRRTPTCRTPEGEAPDDARRTGGDERPAREDADRDPVSIGEDRHDAGRSPGRRAYIVDDGVARAGPAAPRRRR